MKTTTILLAAALLVPAPLAFAQHRGPVASACASEIETYCQGLPHVNRAVRNCLETNKDKVGRSCRQALNATGWGYRNGGGCGRTGGCGPAAGQQAQ
jgi:hypothetical protein